MEFDWSMKPALEQIPPNAKLFVDVGKDMSFMRFDYGTFGNPVSPDNVSLSELDSWTSASFVVRVVDDGNLLAASKKHTLSIAQPDLKSRISLILLIMKTWGSAHGNWRCMKKYNYQNWCLIKNGGMQQWIPASHYKRTRKLWE